eukprot:5858862-Amphidinium_carterae.1
MHAFDRSICVLSDESLQNLKLAAAKGHLNKISDCPGCQLESGPWIIYSKTPKSDRKAGVLYGDLAKIGTDNRQFT